MILFILSSTLSGLIYTCGLERNNVYWFCSFGTILKDSRCIIVNIHLFEGNALNCLSRLIWHFMTVSFICNKQGGPTEGTIIMTDWFIITTETMHLFT